jgi:hypothetical protein
MESKKFTFQILFKFALLTLRFPDHFRTIQLFSRSKPHIQNGYHSNNVESYPLFLLTSNQPSRALPYFLTHRGLTYPEANLIFKEFFQTKAFHDRKCFTFFANAQSLFLFSPSMTLFQWFSLLFILQVFQLVHSGHFLSLFIFQAFSPCP